MKHISQLMIEGMSIAIPDVKIKVNPALMRRWYKEAEAIYDSAGELLEWNPEIIEKWKLGEVKLYKKDGKEMIYETE